MRVKKSAIQNTSMLKRKKNFTAIAISGVLIVAITLGIFFTLSKLFATETYYVMNSDIPAKTQITPTMVIAQETGKGTAPANALSMEDIQRGTLFAKYPLFAGDVIANSNAGTVTNNFDGIPDDWVVVSFTASANNAVDGKILRGDYFDIIGVTGDGSAPTENGNTFPARGAYLATGALVLDVTSSSGGEARTDADGNITTNNSGASLVYTIGVPAEIAPGLIASIGSDNHQAIHLVRSPVSSRYKERDLTAIKGYSALPDFDGDNKMEPKDLSRQVLKDGTVIETDPTFAPIIRDSNFRPVNEETCIAGDIKEPEICEINGFKVKGSNDNKDDKDNSSEIGGETDDSKENK